MLDSTQNKYEKPGLPKLSSFGDLIFPPEKKLSGRPFIYILNLDMNFVFRWLTGLKNDTISAQKTFRMLNAFITCKGDLLEEGKPK